MTLPPSMPATPRVNALQKLWLREIGIEKTWLPAGSVAAPAAPAPAARPAVEPASAPRPDAARAPVSRPVAAAGGAHGPAATPSAAAPARPASRPAPVDKAPVPASAGAPAPATVPVPANDLEAMREQVVQCTACGLCNGRRHAVFGTGAQPARWMVVGEAPGEQEDRQGLPFVGRSGQLLDAMLASVGMSREKDVFIANVIKCRPPGNRNPKPEEIAACSPYLMRQIELLKPERILVLGRFAAQTLLGTDATIGSLRGRRHTLAAPDGREIPVVVSYHPAYLLRSPGEKARAWQDLRLAARLG